MIHSPQHHHTICHESPNGDICNENIIMIDLQSNKKDMMLEQHLLTALFTPANPQQCTNVFSCHAGLSVSCGMQ